jgi:hypothetical protein
LLESFADRHTYDDMEILLSTLSQHKEWPQVKQVLLRNKIKGHTPCFCPRGDLLRRCHPRALDGLRTLHGYMRARSIALP